MLKKFISNYFVESLLVLVLTVLCLVSFIFAKVLDKEGASVIDTTVYVSKEVMPDTVAPVIKEETATLSRPYSDDTVKIVKNYYDKNNEETQNDAIIYYENTYMQNKGIDYAGEKTFSVLAIADGKVISVTTDDIVGTTVKIEHDNNMISIYQSLSEVKVKENDAISKGEVIGMSGTNNINKDLNDHLHFELYVNNIAVNPESYFNKEN